MNRYFLIPLILILMWSQVLVSPELVDIDAQFIMRYLDQVEDLHRYFNDLVSLKTIDLQPIRDLSLWIDLKIFKTFDINLIVLHNFLLWLLCLYFLYTILAKIDVDKKNISIFIILWVGTHPVLSNIVPWGMARKHLLSCLFILCCTSIMVRQGFDQRQKSIFSLYLLSNLSQPINLFWPFWCWIKDRRIYFSLALGLIFLGGVNYFYYLKSPIMLSIFGGKFSEPLAFSDLLLAFGHYGFQIIFPYLLSVNYSLGHWSSFLGIIFWVTLVFFIYKKKDWIWLIFALLPLVIVLRKPTSLYDTYLLVTLVGLGIILFKHLSISKIFFGLVIFINVIFSFFYSAHWKSETELARVSFNNRPSCISATEYLIAQYSNARVSDDKTALNFLLSHECTLNKNFQRLQLVRNYILYYEDIYSLEQREKFLIEMMPRNFMSEVILAGFYLKTGMSSKADIILKKLSLEMNPKNLVAEYEPVIKNSLYPYCTQKPELGCKELMAKFIVKQKSIFYR